MRGSCGLRVAGYTADVCVRRILVHVHLEFACIRMAGSTIDVCMRAFQILLLGNNPDGLPGFKPGGSLPFDMTMYTQGRRLDFSVLASGPVVSLLDCREKRHCRFPAHRRSRKQVAGRAFRIVIGKSRKGGFCLVAGAALLVPGGFGIEFSHAIFPEPGLMMGNMAMEAVLVSPRVIDASRSVNTFFQVVHNVIVTHQAGLEIERFTRHPANIRRIRMQITFRFFVMAIDA
jgi:hypothetical protein